MTAARAPSAVVMHALRYPMLIDLRIYEETLRRSGVLAREAAPKPW